MYLVLGFCDYIANTMANSAKMANKHHWGTSICHFMLFVHHPTSKVILKYLELLHGFRESKLMDIIYHMTLKFSKSFLEDFQNLFVGDQNCM